MFFQLSLNESCNCTDRSVPGVAFDEKESAAGNRQIQKARGAANPPPLRHHYLDELAVRSVRRQKLAAGDREIDLLRPFVAAKMWRDVPNFVAVQGQGRGVGNELVPCSCRSELAD
jgi:hypothetical protein